MLLFSPAKINLHLAVIARRSDGFHEIESIFQAINLADKIWIYPRIEKKLAFSVHKKSSIAGVTKNYNLYKDQQFFKIFKRLKKKWNLPFAGIEICLQKNIPIGAGLGGGSSNMAAFLLGLVALKNCWKSQLPTNNNSKNNPAKKNSNKHTLLFSSLTPKQQTSLHLEAERLGSDVPFFLHGGLALVSGRGEKVAALPFTLNNKAFLIFPPLHIASGKAYSKSLTMGRFFQPKNLTSLPNAYLVPALTALLKGYQAVKKVAQSSNESSTKQIALKQKKQVAIKQKPLAINSKRGGVEAAKYITAIKTVVSNFLQMGNEAAQSSKEGVAGLEVSGNAFFIKTLQEHGLINQAYKVVDSWVKKNEKTCLVNGLSGSGSTLFWLFHAIISKNKKEEKQSLEKLLKRLNKQLISVSNNIQINNKNSSSNHSKSKFNEKIIEKVSLFQHSFAKCGYYRVKAVFNNSEAGA